MVDFIKRLILTQHLDESQSFATLGRVSSGLLHEIKGAISPLLLLLNKLENNFNIESTENYKKTFHQLSQAIKKVHQLALTDLEFITKITAS